jgi:hypothetical protein
MNQLKVFISYRRSDTQHVAGRLGDRIGTRFTLFMDIDDIPPGVDFTTVVRRAIDESDVLLVLIGPHFLGVGADGERRLDKSGDWVAEEVGTGLARDIAVVPVLVDGAQMPSAAELPGKLKGLAHRQALRLTHVSFNSDAERLIETLDDIERRKFGATDPQRRSTSPHAAPGELFGDPDYSRAIAAAFNRRWVQAIELFEAVDRRFPEDDRVRGPLAEARRGLRLEQLEDQAAEAERNRHWRAATASLEELATERPDDTDLLKRLERAKREARIEDLSGQLRAMFVAEEWVGVGVLSSQIAQIDPERADPEGLATTAAGNLADRQLGERYAAALNAYAEGRPADALAEFEAIQEQRPGFREVDDLVAMLRQRLGIGTASAPGPSVSEPEPVPERAPDKASEPQPQPQPIPAPGQAATATEAPAAVKPSAPAPLAESGLPWLAVLAVGVLFVMTQVTFSSYGSLGPLLAVVLLGLGVLIGLLVRDARRSDAHGRLLLISAIWAPVVGVGSLLASVPLVTYLDNNVVDVDSALVVWGSLIPIAVAVAVYAAIRRLAGRTAIWPALIVLVAALTTAVIVQMAIG